MIAHFLTALAALAWLLTGLAILVLISCVGSHLAIRAAEWWQARQRRSYGPRLIYGPTDPIAADESVAAVLGWHDPFTVTRRQIAALPTREIA